MYVRGSSAKQILLAALFTASQAVVTNIHGIDSRWIKVTEGEAFEAEAKAKPNSVSVSLTQSQTVGMWPTKNGM